MSKKNYRLKQGQRDGLVFTFVKGVINEFVTLCKKVRAGKILRQLLVHRVIFVVLMFGGEQQNHCKKRLTLICAFEGMERRAEVCWTKQAEMR